MSTEYENFIARFVKENRKRQDLTQEELAVKAGVGLRFIRELEQGKESLRMDKVNQVLQLFGFTLTPGPGRRKDPYEILRNHTNKSIHISLKDKTEVYGIIIDPVMEGNEIKAWKLVRNKNAIEYQKKEDPKLLEEINNDDIAFIENL